jgi:hypothetical protein
MDMKFNQTLIKAFDCPRRGHLLGQYMDKHGKTPSSGPALTGQAVHDFISQYLRHCMEIRELTDFVHADKLKLEVAAKFPTTLDFKDYSYIVDEFVKSEVAPSDGAVLLEQVLETDDFHGTPDKIVVHNEAFTTIEDWKTDRRIRTLAEVEAAFQLKFYAYLWLLANDEEVHPDVFELAMVFVRCGHPISYEMTLEEVWQFGEYVKAKVAEIRAMTEFPPVPSEESCKWCEFMADCPADLGILELIPGEAEAVAAAKQVKLITSQKDRLNKMLKEYVNKSGPVIVGDESLDFHVTEPLKWPEVLPLIDMLLDNDVAREDVYAAMNTTTTALKKICKREDGEELWKKIEALSTTKKQTNFGFKKGAK